MRWRRLTLLLGSALPPLVLLEDVIDLVTMKIQLMQAIPAAEWGVPEAIDIQQKQSLKGIF